MSVNAVKPMEIEPVKKSEFKTYIMKKLMGMLVVFVLFVTLGYSQQKKERASKINDFTPEQIATLKSKKMALQLDLNENQQQEAFKLFKSFAENRKNNFKSLKKEKWPLLTSDEKFKLKSEQLDHQIAQKKALQKILSKEQFEKWEKSTKMCKHYKKHNRRSNKK